MNMSHVFLLISAENVAYGILSSDVRIPFSWLSPQSCWTSPHNGSKCFCTLPAGSWHQLLSKSDLSTQI